MAITNRAQFNKAAYKSDLMAVANKVKQAELSTQDLTAIMAQLSRTDPGWNYSNPRVKQQVAALFNAQVEFNNEASHLVKLITEVAQTL